MKRTKIIVPICIVALTISIIGMNLPMGTAAIAMPQNPAFRWETNVGSWHMFQINELINGVQQNRVVGFNLSAADFGQIPGPLWGYDRLNFTKLIYNVTTSQYETNILGGICYYINSSDTTHFWSMGSLNETDPYFPLFYASILIPVNISTGTIDLNFWGKLMSSTLFGGMNLYGGQLNLTEYKVVGSTLELYNSTLGYYCNMTFSSNGLMQSARTKFYLPWLMGTGGWLEQNYTRSLNPAILNPIDETHFTLTPTPLIYRNYQNGSLAFYSAYNNIIEYTTNTSYQGQDTYVVVANGTVYQNNPMMEGWNEQGNETMGMANDWQNNMLGYGLPIIFKQGTTPQSLNASFYPTLVGYMKLFDLIEAGSNWLKYTNTTDGWYIYYEFSINGRVSNRSYCIETTTTFMDIEDGTPLDSTSFSLPNTLVYEANDNSTGGYNGYEKYNAFNQYIEPTSNAMYYVNATKYVYTTVDPAWNLNESSTVVGGGWDHANAFAIGDNSMPLIFKSGTTGQDINQTYNFVFAMMMGLDTSVVTSNSCKFVNSTNDYFIYLELNAQFIISNLSVLNDFGEGETVNQSLILQVAPTPSVSLISTSPSSNGVVQLSWNAVGSNYTIYRADHTITTIDGSVSKLNTQTGTTYSDLITTEKTVYYVVQAIIQLKYGANFSSDLSNNIAVIIDFPSPDAPKLDAITPNPNPNGTIVITWSAVANAEYYLLYRCKSCITVINSSVKLVTNTTKTSYVDSGLTDGTYYYAVVAVNATGNSSFSKCESVVVKLDEGGIPGYPIPIISLVCLTTIAVLLIKRKRRIEL